MRQYVKDMQEAGILLDVLAAEGAGQIEPTRAVAGRQALYPEVSTISLCLARFDTGTVPSNVSAASWYQSKSTLSRIFQCKRI